MNSNTKRGPWTWVLAGTILAAAWGCGGGGGGASPTASTPAAALAQAPQDAVALISLTPAPGATLRKDENIAVRMQVTTTRTGVWAVATVSPDGLFPPGSYNTHPKRPVSGTSVIDTTASLNFYSPLSQTGFIILWLVGDNPTSVPTSPEACVPSSATSICTPLVYAKMAIPAQYNWTR
jgi:hypothetical protein